MALPEYIVDGEISAPVSAFQLAEMFHSGQLVGKMVRVVGTGALLSGAELKQVVDSVQLPPQIQAAPTYQAPTDGNKDPIRFFAPVAASGWAVAAGYLGLFSVLFVFAPFSVFAGLMALRDLKKNPHKTGKGRAIFGLVMGVACFVFWGSIILANMIF